MRQERSSTTTCDVCGGEALSRHFGGRCCETCKAFFRRAVQKNSYSKFRCVFTANCTISPTNRTCKKCRFAKCLRIGMNPKWVMNDVDRWARNQKRTLRHHGNRQGDIERIYNPDDRQFKNRLTDDEYASVVDMVAAYNTIVAQVTHKDVARKLIATIPNIDDDIEATSICLATKSRTIRFVSNLPDFRVLLPTDRDVLILSHNVLEASYMRSFYCFDTKTKSWPNDTVAEGRYDGPDAPIPHSSWDGELTEEMAFLFENMLHKMNVLKIDEPCIILLMMIALFSPTVAGLVQVRQVEIIQERYLSILQKYVQWRYGALNGSVVYPKLLSLLTDMKELSDRECEDGVIDSDEAELVDVCLQIAQWNPYSTKEVETESPLSPISVDSSTNADSGYATSVHSVDPPDDDQGTGDDLYALLESLNDTFTCVQPELEDIVDSDDLLQPLFMNSPDPQYIIDL